MHRVEVFFVLMTFTYLLNGQIKYDVVAHEKTTEVDGVSRPMFGEQVLSPSSPSVGMNAIFDAFLRMDFTQMPKYMIKPLYAEIDEIQQALRSYESVFSDAVTVGLDMHENAGKVKLGNVAYIKYYVIDQRRPSLTILLTYYEESDTPILRAVELMYGDQLQYRFPIYFDQVKPILQAVDGLSPTATNQESIIAYEQATSYLEKTKTKAQYYFNDLDEILGSYYGGLAWYYVLAGRGQDAIIAASQGLNYTPEKVWINANLAHGYLLNGQLEEAKNVYLKYKNDVYNGQTLQQMYKDDFGQMRHLGVNQKHIDQILKLID